MKDLISAALVTDTELVVDRHYVSDAVDWLANHGHQIVQWEGLIRSPKGKYTVSPQYSLSGASGEHGLESVSVEEIKETMAKTYRQFMVDHMADGSELYFCIRLREKTDLAYRRVGWPMRVLAAVVGSLFIGHDHRFGHLFEDRYCDEPFWAGQKPQNLLIR